MKRLGSMRNMGRWALALLALGAASATAQIAQRKTPYWGSISAGEARMRTGPGRNYPANWLYQRAGLPVKVIEVYPGWRKVRDPDGAEGWMIGNLVSDQRTAMVSGAAVVELRDAPNPGARVLWRAEPGVIGRVTRCGEGWCKIDVKGRGGFVETSHLWGVDAGETFG
jgi:SH3-like domain-containing protein